MFKWVLLLAVPCSGFLFDNAVNYECLAPPPCKCSGAIIDCTNTGLNSVPDFKMSDRELPRLILLLNNNFIKEIDNTSFVNLDSTNASIITINLSNNHIMEITESSFDTIAPLVYSLNFQNNNMTEVPNALQTLSNLETLDLRRNPIRSLASPATFTLSKSLKNLAISLNLFSKWPAELRYFRQLSKLTLDGFQQQRFPLNAMTGIESTLTSLDISNTRLDRIPSAVCHLPHLRRLTYTSNPETKTPIFEPCNQNISSLYFVSLKANNLTHFPDIFSTFVALDYLDLADNEIRTIDANVIPIDNSLTHLNLSNNHLNRLPSAINRFTALKSLSVAGNRVTSLEDYDLINLTHLTVFQLDNNPLEYISDNAFQSIRMFDVLNLDNTKVNTIPKAVVSLAGINRLNIDDTPIQCTCKMDYLKSWKNNASRIHGTCEGTRETLTSFISTYLPLCL